MIAATTTGVERWTDLILGPPLQIVGTVIVAVLLRWLAHRLINRVARGLTTGTAGLAAVVDRGRDEQSIQVQRVRQRSETIASALRSLASAVIGTVAVLTVLEIASIPVGPLLASAGIAGVALGFGAQSLVKDVINGIFMLAEDQYGVGDTVDLGVASGTVESVGLRITRVRAADGTLWHVRNGEVLRVANRSQGYGTATLDLVVAEESALDRARELLAEIARQVCAEAAPELAVRDAEVLGVQRFDADGVTLRVTMSTAPLQEERVFRDLQRRVLDRFAGAGIRISGSGTPAEVTDRAGGRAGRMAE